MKQSEKIAYDWLKMNDWNPQKSESVAGNPDFKCFKRRWVEVKLINEEGLISNLTVSQINCWNKLIKKENKVYLMLVSNKEVFLPMNVKEFNFLNLVSNIERKSPKTTIRVYHLEIVKTHAMKNIETFNKYINRLIDEDILKTGDTETVIGYFDKEEIPR